MICRGTRGVKWAVRLNHMEKKESSRKRPGVQAEERTEEEEKGKGESRGRKAQEDL